MDWRQFVMDLGPLPAAAVEALFTRHGAHAVTLSDASDDAVLEPLRGETPLWTDTRITGLFSPDANFDALRQELSTTFALTDLPPHRVEELEDRAWEREWLQDFKPLSFGERLWVCPRGQAPGQADAAVVELDPGLAFGTGSHPTTALCLGWIDRVRERLPGCSVLDFGCGSGILAIAALKLGAKAATCYDIDPQAVTATLANAEQNGVAAQVTAATERPGGQYDIVLANILAAPLIENAAWLCEQLQSDALLALSGILRQQVDGVQAAYSPWIEFTAPVYADNWALLSGHQR